MIISRKHKFIFIKSKKTAGSSIQAALATVCSETDLVTEFTHNNYSIPDHKRKHQISYKLLKNKKKHINSPLSKIIISHTPLKKLKFIFQDEYNNFFKFAFIRNPWDLVVSKYFWHKHIHKHDLEDFTQWLWQKYQFELWKTDQLHLYTHVDGEYDLDFMGRYENIQQDFQFVCDKLCLGNLKLENEKRIYRKRKHYTEYYSEQDKQLVAKLFQQDIDYFGYKFGEN